MKLLILALCTLCVSGIALADNAVDISMNSMYGMDTDTLYFGTESQFVIAIENDFPIYGMSLGFRIYSPDEVGWIWRNMGSSGYGPHACVTVESGTRMYPAEDVFDLSGGLSITEYDMDEEGSDVIMIGGVALFSGLAAGSLEQMVSLHLYPAAPGNAGYGEVYTLCIDSVFVPPNGAFVFVDASGEPIIPQTLWDTDGACFPATLPSCDPPVLIDGVTSTQVRYLGSRTIENAASWEDWCNDDISISLKEVIGGLGTAEVVDHGDGTCDVTYHADEADLGNTVQVVVEALNTFFQVNPANLYTLNFEVVEQPACLLGGDANDDGSVNVGDVVFLINYVFKEGPAPDVPKATDANQDCQLNIGDALYLIGSIFKGGPVPTCSNCDF